MTNYQDIFKEAQRQLETLSMAERRRARELDRIEDIDEHLQLSRAEERELLLPKSRICPRCLVQKLDPQQWVILIDGSSDTRWRTRWRHHKRRRANAISRGQEPPTIDIEAVCKACTMVRTADYRGNPFTPVIYWVADSKRIRRARHELSLSGTAVADACGWSQPRQSILESRSDYVISHTEAEMLQNVLELRSLPVVGEHITKYRVDSEKFAALRKAAGASRRLVGTWLGVTGERVRTFETKDCEVQGRIVEIMIRGFARMIRGDSEDSPLGEPLP